MIGNDWNKLEVVRNPKGAGNSQTGWKWQETA